LVRTSCLFYNHIGIDFTDEYNDETVLPNIVSKIGVAYRQV